MLELSFNYLGAILFAHYLFSQENPMNSQSSWDEFWSELLIQVHLTFLFSVKLVFRSEHQSMAKTKKNHKQIQI